MSKNRGGNRGSGPQEPHSASTAAVPVPVLELAALPELDLEPPPLANIVQVRGGADAVRVTFFYLSDVRLNEIERRKGDGIERVNDHTTIVRQRPVARVTLTTTGVMELIAQLMETLARGTPELVHAVQSGAKRMATAGQVFSELSIAADVAKQEGESEEQ